MKADLRGGKPGGLEAGKIDEANAIISNNLLKVPKSWISGWLLGETTCPTTKEWATMAIPGWSTRILLRTLALRCCHGLTTNDNEGHVGIVVAPGATASVNALMHPAGIITINDWGFRPSGQSEEHSGDRVVVRHYVGDSQ